jgi:hypothetical protein
MQSTSEIVPFDLLSQPEYRALSGGLAVVE